jgi:hypothetical protein
MIDEPARTASTLLRIQVMRSKSGAIKVVPFQPLKDTSGCHNAKTLYRLKLFAAGRYFERSATIQELILLAVQERVTASSASAFCYHGKRKKDCRLYSTQYFCDFHGRPRKTCKECNGGGSTRRYEKRKIKGIKKHIIKLEVEETEAAPPSAPPSVAPLPPIPAPPWRLTVADLI